MSTKKEDLDQNCDICIEIAWSLLEEFREDLNFWEERLEKGLKLLEKRPPDEDEQIGVDFIENEILVSKEQIIFLEKEILKHTDLKKFIADREKKGLPV